MATKGDLVTKQSVVDGFLTKVKKPAYDAIQWWAGAGPDTREYRKMEANGWADLGGGLMLQWGTANVNYNQTETSVTFPRAYSGNAYIVIANPGRSASASGLIVPNPHTLTSTGCTILGEYNHTAYLNVPTYIFSLGPVSNDNSGAPRSLGQNGWADLPNNVTIQWQVVSANYNQTNTAVTFPKAFGGRPYSVQTTVGRNTVISDVLVSTINSVTPSGCNIFGEHGGPGATNVTTYLFAIGPTTSSGKNYVGSVDLGGDLLLQWGVFEGDYAQKDVTETFPKDFTAAYTVNATPMVLTAVNGTVYPMPHSITTSGFKAMCDYSGPSPSRWQTPWFAIGKATSGSYVETTLALDVDNPGSYEIAGQASINVFSTIKNKTTLGQPGFSGFTDKVCIFGLPHSPGSKQIRSMTTPSKVVVSDATRFFYQYNEGSTATWGQNIDESEPLVFEYSIDGTNWIQIEKFGAGAQKANQWISRSPVVPSGAKVAGSVFLRFWQTTGGTDTSLQTRDSFAITSLGVLRTKTWTPPTLGGGTTVAAVNPGAARMQVDKLGPRDFTAQLKTTDLADEKVVAATIVDKVKAYAKYTTVARRARSGLQTSSGTTDEQVKVARLLDSYQIDYTYNLGTGGDYTYDVEFKDEFGLTPTQVALAKAISAKYFKGTASIGNVTGGTTFSVNTRMLVGGNIVAVTNAAWQQAMNDYAIWNSDRTKETFEYNGSLLFPFTGEYTFLGLSDNNASVYIDGNLVMEFNDFTSAPITRTVTIAEGNRQLRIVASNVGVYDPVADTNPAGVALVISGSNASSTPAYGLFRDPDAEGLAFWAKEVDTKYGGNIDSQDFINAFVLAARGSPDANRVNSPQKQYDPGEASSNAEFYDRPLAPGDVTKGKIISASGLDKFYEAIRKTAQQAQTLATVVDLRVCHSSCHSSCHGARGRR